MKHFLRLVFTLSLALSFMDSVGQTLNMDKLKGMKPRSIGPAGMSGRITAIDVVLQEPHIIYAGAASGGLWKSTSGGITWEPIFDQESTLSVGAIAIQQDNPSVIWVGTGEGNPRNSLNGGDGIYKSLDGGKTWKRLGLEKTRHIHRVIIDPKNPNTVYVGAIGSPWGTHPERGVYKTTDGGQTWERVLYVNDKTGCAELVMDPTNPNKLFASMWEHQRWPWTFKSGGPGSGLYVTFDGGKTWALRTSKDGLPEGELGRIGLAIARSKPDRVYALVESKKNALYRSDDGGFKWTMVNDKGEIGNRPFYYFEIYADPQNENRLYSLFSYVNVSEDGGKSFRTLLPYEGVHPDHHAWWIHPNNPSYMIDGNDGGLNITHDMGKTWRFAENIPAGQFYHINVDNAHPYNVYGGMQDNGSWTGPAYVWRAEGIRNSYWQEVLFGDGFDVSPDPENNRYGYAMSQGGALRRYDMVTGHTQALRPVHPDPNLKLRFNWNAGLAQDPFNPSALYYGSQFLHKSENKGNTWAILSPDLTTNNPTKQKQNESGGLTIDDTGAENHCTIIAIAPSPVEKGVIWVSTDDGNVQLTRDGGKNWANLSPKMQGLPPNAWIAHIHASPHRAGEAYIVANHYRQFDYKPYVFRTRDFGATWENIVSTTQVGENNFALTLVQDPVEPNLLFLGTENGLWVSLTGGKTWSRWTNGYPTGVSTMDLVIHPREQDLVIATFGRALYILDDIRPLREMASKGTQLLDKTVHLFTPPDAYHNTVLQPDGIRFHAHAMFNGQNRPFGAMVSYVINRPATSKTVAKPTAPDKGNKKGPVKTEEIKPALATTDKVTSDTLTLEVFRANGEKIRTIKEKAPEENGLHRIFWDMEEKGSRFPSREKPKPNDPERASLDALPGPYKIRLSFAGQKDSVSLTIKDDPRIHIPTPVREARYKMLKDLDHLVEVAALAMDQLRESKEVAQDFEKKLKESNRPELKETLAKTRTMIDSLNNMMNRLVGKEERGQSIIRNPDPTPMTFIFRANQYISSATSDINETDKLTFQQAERKIDDFLKNVNLFFETSWKDYRATMEKTNLSPFKNFVPIKR